MIEPNWKAPEEVKKPTEKAKKPREEYKEATKQKLIELVLYGNASYTDIQVEI
jgi:hypothetical protein